MHTSPQKIIAFRDTLTDATDAVIDDLALVDTPYSFRSWRHFTNEAKGAVSGIWEAGPHLERCNYDFDELCHILEGTVRLTDADGVSEMFSVGDSFVVAAGFRGTWENLTQVRKVFFILT
ncbi:cupin domain-containing protein [Leisingera caerulea]|uniref:cupin domain-containing protein n=1 Tax=Leisingera caerulea TaxID=506591 RepID=UPI00040182B9|nr:cupin domain-containing protein [Leisingera caerulea]